MEWLRDKLETGSNVVVVLAAKGVMTLDDMIWIQAHETMDTRQKKVWTAIDIKGGVLNYHHDRNNLNSIDFLLEFAGSMQWLRMARVTIGQEECVIDKILREQGLTQVTATQA